MRSRSLYLLPLLVAATACGGVDGRPAPSAPTDQAPRTVAPSPARSATRAFIPNSSTTAASSAPATASPRQEVSSPVAPAPQPPPGADGEEPTYLTSIRYKTFIRRKPRANDPFLGYIRVGQRVALKSPETVPGEGCPKGFYRIEPRGFVCHDRTVTLERTSPFIVANSHTDPTSGPFPYRFALSNGAPMYSRLPSQAEWVRREKYKYGPAGEFRPLSLFQRGHEHLAVVEPIAPVNPLPPFLKNGRSARGVPLSLIRRTIPHGSMLAYTRAFDHQGRTFLLSADLTLVPADRVRPFRRSTFRGVELGDEVKLPIAWFIGKPRPQYRRSESGEMELNGASWPVRTFVQLSDETNGQGKHRYLRVRGEELWVKEKDVSVMARLTKKPFLVKQGQRFVIVSISRGTLVAYDESMTPVYGTLMSPGQGGVPRKGGDNVKDSTTPLGTYNLTFKDRAATMSPEFGEDRSFWIADVPWTQYFNPPFALHGAYWHEKFGEPMSGGCINVSPIDAEILFNWTEPKVPPGWQGATAAGARENGFYSAVVVRR